MRFAYKWNSRRRQSHEYRKKSACRHQTCQSSRTREQQCLRQSLPDQPSSTCSNCCPHRKLPLLCGSASHHQTGDIDTRDQEHSENEPQENPRHRLRVLRLSVPQRSDAEPDFLTCFRGKLLQFRFENRLHLCIRLSHAHARLEPCKHPHRIAESAIDRLLDGRIQGHWKHDVCCFQRGELKASWEYSHHTPWAAVHIDCPFQNLRIAAVMALPQPVRDHHYRRPVGAILFRQKVSAEDRGDPKQRKESQLERNTVQLFRIVLDQVAIVNHCTLTHESRKRLLIVLPFSIEASHEELLMLQRVRHAHRNNSTRICVRQRSKQDAVHHAKNRCGGSYAERKGYENTQRKKRITAKTATCVSNVLKYRPDPPSRVLPIAFVPRRLDTTKLNERLAARLTRA